MLRKFDLRAETHQTAAPLQFDYTALIVGRLAEDEFFLSYEKLEAVSLRVGSRLGMRPAGLIRREGLIEGQSGLHPNAPFALYRTP